MGCVCRAGLAAVVAAALGLAGPAGASLARGGVGSGGPPAQFDVAGRPASNQIIVEIRPRVLDRVKAMQGLRGRRGHGRAQEALSPAVQEVCRSWGVLRVRPAYPLEFAHPELAARHGIDRVYIVEVPRGTDTPAMAAAFRQCREDVSDAGVSMIGGVARFIPNDPYFEQQYGMHNTGQTFGTVDADIDAPEAWAVHTGDPGTVTVAIIDSGINPHVDFADRLVPGVNTNLPPRCVDGINDGELCADDQDCPGGSCEFSDLTDDELWHGTHVAGIVAAQGNNGIGVAGVTWGAYLMPVRVTNSAGCGDAQQAANGLVWAADHGADICNMSLQYPLNPGGPEENYFRGCVDYAHDLGTLMIAAAGNGGEGVSVPARFENCMAVSATDHDDEFYDNSNYGNELDVCAPGVNVYSTMPNDGYTWRTGTSMAAPHVSGLAALLKSYADDLTNDEIRSILVSAADDLGPAGWDDHYGHGRINAFAALMVIIDSWPPDGAIDARQPCRPDGSEPEGWASVSLTFLGDAAGMDEHDFNVSVDPPGDAPGIVDTTWNGNTITLKLGGAIPVEAWTTVTHVASGNSVRFGYLPGDVNATGVTDPEDIPALINALDDDDPLPIWSRDINHSGRATAQDILRLIDLLNGADTYDVFLGATLP